MALRSTITKRIEVPGELDQYIEIRMLSWLTLNEARRERLKEVAGMREIIAMYREVAQNGSAIETAKAEAAKDPFQQYDPLTLLKHGLVAWSYGAKVDVTEFDEKTAEWAAREILAYTLPSEQESKTPSSLSTGI